MNIPMMMVEPPTLYLTQEISTQPFLPQIKGNWVFNFHFKLPILFTFFKKLSLFTIFLPRSKWSINSVASESERYHPPSIDLEWETEGILKLFVDNLFLKIF